MQEHRKVIILFITGVMILVSCSETRKLNRGRDTNQTAQPQNIKVSRIISQNTLTDNDFEISKFRAKITYGKERSSFTGYLRYAKKGKYLLSIRTIAGIEAARILVERDSVKIIDRINKQYIHGKLDALRKRYGLSWEDIPLLLGDLNRAIAKSGELKCLGGFADLSQELNRKLYQFKISCNVLKMSKMSIVDGVSEKSVRGFYNNFLTEGKVTYPHNIEIEFGNITASIIIEKVNLNKKPLIKFNKGKGYDEYILK